MKNALKTSCWDSSEYELAHKGKCRRAPGMVFGKNDKRIFGQLLFALGRIKSALKGRIRRMNIRGRKKKEEDEEKEGG
jgi:hypothetical protein